MPPNQQEKGSLIEKWVKDNKGNSQNRNLMADNMEEQLNLTSSQMKNMSFTACDRDLK